MHATLKYMTSKWLIGAVVGTSMALPLVFVYAQSTEGEVASSTPPVEETAAPEASTSFASSTEFLPIIGDVGSTTVASGTPVIITPTPPVKADPRTIIIQPSVDIPAHVKVGPVSATISLRNLTCRSCENASPSVGVVAYITPWYANDEADVMKAISATTTSKIAETSAATVSIAPWQEQTVSWTGEVIEPGRYYFVVVVDPENAVGAKDLYRAEFLVD